MLSRLMDLVVLVAELSQSTDRKYKNLGQELATRGYSSDEIEQAVFWYSSRRDVSSDDDSIVTLSERPVRVLSEFERMSMSSDSYGYLLRLMNLGLIGVEQFERIMARAIPVGPEKTGLSEVKAIACSVVFNRDAHDFDDEFDQFDEDVATT